MSYSKGSGFAPHNMTANNLPSPYVAAASTTWGSAYPYKAFDGLLGVGPQYWLTNGVATGWLSLDIGVGNSKKLYSYKVYVSTIPEPNRAPKNWTLEGSNDNINWTTLDTQVNQTAWGSGEGREFTLDPSKMGTAYRYFRLNVSANNGDSYLQCGELYLYEAVLVPTTLVPTTLSPTTKAPTTLPPTTLAPTTKAPTTLIPTTLAPTTKPPTTLTPTTHQPSTSPPTTVQVTTKPPTTIVITTFGPTTAIITTLFPTSVLPTSLLPSTFLPTSLPPTTLIPTTLPPYLCEKEFISEILLSAILASKISLEVTARGNICR